MDHLADNQKNNSQNNDYVDLDALEADLSEKKPQKDKNKKSFNIYNFFYNREGKGAEEEKFHKRDLPYFFVMTWRYLTELFITNLYFVPFLLIFILAFSQNLHDIYQAPADALYAPIYGALAFDALSPVSSAFYGLYGASSNVAMWTPLSYGVLIAGIVLLLIAFGPLNTGITYIMRNIVKGEHLFMWKDFWHAIKKNLRQEFVFGILDLVVALVGVHAVYSYYLTMSANSSFGNGLMFAMSLVVCALWIVMRFYIYTLMITFDLTVFQILKNSLIFALVGFKRNIMALIGIVSAVVINMGIMVLYLPLGIILPFIITISLCMFMGCYASWPKIKEIMIDPYYDENGNPLPQ